MEKESCRTKQVVFFKTQEEFDECNDDSIIKLVMPTGKYCVDKLNFVSCLINSSISKELIFHWSGKRIPIRSYHRDVFELVTTRLTNGGEEQEVRHLIQVYALFEILGIPLEDIPPDFLTYYDYEKVAWYSVEREAESRQFNYNKILRSYCEMNGIAFCGIKSRVKRDNNYMKEMQVPQRP